MKMQTAESKRGEVEFRRKLELQFDGNAVLDNQPSQAEYFKIMQTRIRDTLKKFRKLQKQIPEFSPFLEIGAERTERALVLTNKFNASGFASDISFESLNSARILSKQYRLPKLPTRIVCDAYNLPFSNNSLSFVFCFQTLHHFPNPKPILKEIKRVLRPGGFFYFDEEPISQTCNLNLWRRDYRLRWFERILKYTLLLHFLTRIGRGEVDHHILEETFSLRTWQDSLNIFKQIHTRIKIFPFGPIVERVKNQNSSWLFPNIFIRFVLGLLGGGIEGLGQEPGTIEPKSNLLWYQLLVCPNCSNKPELKFNIKDKSLRCRVCKANYQQKENVYILLTNKQRLGLYPDL